MAYGPVLSGSKSALAREPSDLELGMAWLLRLRWGAALGQLIALAVARYLVQIPLPYLELLGLATVTLGSNAFLVARQSRLAGPMWLPSVLGFDVLLLAVIFALSGGASNPFTVFFLVQLALSAVLLDARWTAFLVALTIAAFGALFLLPSSHHMMHGHGAWSGHLLGMWIAFVFAALFLAYFVGRLASAMRARDVRLATVTQLAAQNERLALLSSFSANAAHELGSPLATIGLAAKELNLALTRMSAPQPLQKDAELIGSELARCRDILATLSARAGESIGEMPQRLRLGKLTEDLLRLLPEAKRARLKVSLVRPANSETTVVAPGKTLTQVLHNLVQNAFDAHAAAQCSWPIELEVSVDELAAFRIQDRGLGLSPSIAARVGEPFVTTKTAEGGLGLGVYLARSYAERFGGSLTFRARAGGGLEVSLCVPRDALGGKL